MTEEASLAEQWFKAPDTKDLFVIPEPEDLANLFQAQFRYQTLTSGAKTILLESACYSLGFGEGVLEHLAPSNKHGCIRIGETLLSFKDDRQKRVQLRMPIAPFVGQKVLFRFFPTGESIPQIQPKNAQAIGLDRIQISYLYRKPPPAYKANLVAANGQLAQVWKSGFELWIWSVFLNQRFRVCFSGKGPKKIGSYVHVKGIFNPASRLIELEDYRELRIAPRSELSFAPSPPPPEKKEDAPK